MIVEAGFDPIELTARLVRAASLSGDEGRAAEVAELAMRELGFRDVWRDRYGSVVGVVGPSGPPILLFDGHLDVVPPSGTWSVDPFGAEVTNGRLYGRGATDMKGGLAAAITGVAKAAAVGELERPVAVSASVLEETIEGVALGAVLDQIEPEAVVICEPSSLRIQLGQRGRLEIMITAKGVTAHAAFPERGRNPVELALKGLAAISEMRLPEHPRLGRGLMVATDVISEPYPSISLIPAAVHMRFDRRTVAGEEATSVVAALSSVLESIAPHEFSVEITKGEVTSYTGHSFDVVRALPPWLLPPTHPLALVAEDAVKGAGLSAQVGAYGFCTNGSESAGRRGIPTIGFGPGAAEEAHIEDESIAIEQIRSAAEVYRRLSSSYSRR